MAKKSRRPSVLGWWQAVLDETKAVVDSGIDRLRDERENEGCRGDLADLFDAIAEVNTKLDALEQKRPGPAPEETDQDS
jgi:hypothetical protein